MKPNLTYLIYAFFFLFGNITLAQQTEEFQIPFKLLKTTQDTLNIDYIIDNASVLFAGPKKDFKSTPSDIFWIQLDFSDHLDVLNQKEKWYVYIEYFNKAKVYYQSQNVISSTILGSFETGNKFTGEFPFTQEQLIETKYLYLKVAKLNVKYNISNHTFICYSETVQYYKQNYISGFHFNSKALTHFFLGVSLIIIIIASTIYFINRKKEYLLYVLFVTCMSLYFGRFVFESYTNTFGGFSFTTFFLNNFFEILSNIFYILFVKYYLNTREFYPKLNAGIRFAVVFLAALLLLDSIVLLKQNFSLHSFLLDIRAFIITAFVFLSIVYLLFHLKHKLTYFIVFGSFFYSAGSVMVFLTGYAYYVKTGALIEIIIFGLGLGYKIKLEYQEKLAVQQQAIENYIKALRAQMNPHFIFNSLSSIQHLILKSDTPSALKYLSKFSQLMRSTLENSIEKNVTLAEEIKLLQTYLDLESLRFDSSFSYEINVDKHLNTQLLEVPLLIIQPFVENAILHGLLPKKEGEKKVTISFSEDIHHITATIEDTGIGREASKSLHKKNTHMHKVSRGIELTEKRIEVLKSLHHQAETYKIEDLRDASGNPAGTRVIVKIPKN
ncbi:MAG: histidine kinase [Flavobacteriaceae bacterium]